MIESLGLKGTVLVVRGDETVYEASGGYASVAEGTRCAPDNRFQLASISKQFTAAATLLEVEAGRVRLEDRVGAFIAGCPSSWAGITVHHLLTHTAGLNHWPDHADLDLCAEIAPAAAIQAFQRLPLRFAPGSDWYYSSPGYVLLAHIVELTSGRPYRTYLQELIFEPVGLSDTFVGMPAADVVRVAEPYRGGAMTPSFELNSIGMGAGDVWSTTHDLVRWDSALAAGEFLSEKSRELTFTPHARTDRRFEESYGYGWQLGKINGHQARFHSGGNAGFSTYNAWFPDLDAYLIVLSNDDTTDSRELTIKLAEAWL